MARLSHTDVLRALVREAIERGVHPDRARILVVWEDQETDHSPADSDDLSPGDNAGANAPANKKGRKDA